MPSKIVSPRAYLRVFAALLLLLALTCGAHFLDLGALSIVVAMTISLLKAGLIVLFFMEVRYSRPIVWLFAAAGLVWLLIMVTLTMSDYGSRSWVPPDWRAGVNAHSEFARGR